MSERLKDIFFANVFIEQLGQAIGQVYPEFDQQAFTCLVYDDTWTTRELKAKMRHLTRCLRATLPEDYPKALEMLIKVAPSFNGFDALVFPDYVECYGLDQWDLSMPALAVFTQQGSSEFAVRPFLLKDPQRAMTYLSTWAESENHHLRRLASEGCRPRLPWAIALPAFKKDPRLILPILEKLKADESDYVRKSVANNLNDISKDHPNLMLAICERWYGLTNHTDWIVKHACRGLLKAGNERALRLFGFAGPTGLSLASLTLDKAALAIGETLSFTFELRAEAATPQQVRLEYKVHFVKASGKTSPKVFQIREGLFDPGSYLISRKHSFEDRTTRRHHPGPHRIAIVVNGTEMAVASFDLVTQPPA